MLPEIKWEQYSMPREYPIDGITIHNTNTDLTVDECYQYLLDSTSSNGTHYLVDYEKIIECIPLDRAVFHTGKGYDYGNLQTIAIEIVSNINNEKYKQGQDRAVQLIKELMEEYNLTEHNLYFHNDFENVYCPSDILTLYGDKKTFIREEIL